MRHLCSLLPILLLLVVIAPRSAAQRVIEYEAGMGTRDHDNPTVWVLYDHVRATHEGMVLHADSAWLNTERNDFNAIGNVKIEITDTTFIYGHQLYYDGNQRTVDIWGDTVVLIDGETTLRTPQVSYDRNSAIASYSVWGHTISGTNEMRSREGYYNSETKLMDIYRHVVLNDSTTRLLTDTLHYDTRTKQATFSGPTYIYSDSATFYSQAGLYDTETNYARSTLASHLHSHDGKHLTGDTLHYYHDRQRGQAHGHVVITDSLNGIIATGHYGETDQQQQASYVTDSALIMMIDRSDSLAPHPDTLYLHADTLRAINDSSRHLVAISAAHHIKVFRHDVQAMSDSAYYDAADSTLRIYHDPVLWYDRYQCSADSIIVRHDSSGLRQAFLEGHSMVIQQVDPEKYNQLSGKRTIVHFADGEPTHADILGNAQMVYYITETDSLDRELLVGVNAGVGAQMRIYFAQRKPQRVVTYDKPDMNTYPIDQLPPEMRRLDHFRWLTDCRPRNPKDIFRW